MERNFKTEKKLHSYLNEFNLSENDFSKGNLYHQLLDIESYFQEVTKNQFHYFKLLKESKKLNVNKVSNKTNISRSSIYSNSNILLYYINKRIDQINDSDITMLDSLNKQNNRVSLLENINNELKQQVVDTYELKLYILELEQEVKSQYERRQKDIDEINNLREEMRSIKNQLGKSTNNKIINLRNED
ncbi:MULTISPECIES: hypothetical protein [unclassified Mammaliicoccus]|uniref:hypothetical protein n=1 Tax=unclassified Mammaliicoccus TaxID=2803851 RepID=UPI001EFA814A|nr:MULTISPECIES: hypothetical protein [unclassified Mammaliicoccus]